MQAVILAGGKGTRLRPLTCGTPKPLVPVVDRPLLEHVILNLKKHGIDDIVITLSYLPEIIERELGDGHRFGVRLHYVMETEPLGTAGAVKNAESFINQSFFVFNGDILSGIDLTGMMKGHLAQKARATIALTPVDNPTIYGVVETDRTGLVQRFVEKPNWDKVTTNMINAGIYVLEPDVLKYLEPGKPAMFENFLFPKIIKTGEPVLSFPSSDYWIDIGSPEKYLKANHDMLRQRRDKIIVEEKCVVAPNARLEPPVFVGKGCRIAAGAKIIGPAVIGPGCDIGEKATIEQSVLWEGTRVGAASHLKSSVTGQRCVIAEECYLEECVLGNDVVVGNNTREWQAKIPADCSVSPRA